MPLDGLSFSNTGLYRIPTPLEAAFQAEQAVQIQTQITTKKVNEIDKSKTDVKEKDADEKTDLEGRDTSDTDDQDDQQSFLEKKDNIKKYRVKFNSLTDMVELVDVRTGLVIETISPDDLVNLISKSKEASGVLVDRQI